MKFEFFSKVTNLGVTGNRITSIDVNRQATVTSGEYQPLVRVGDLDCWPDRPDYDQLAEGAELRDRGINLESFWAPWPGVGERHLRAGRDFDDVVLGIAPGAFPHICAELDANPGWAQMVATTKTTQTLAMQLSRHAL